MDASQYDPLAIYQQPESKGGVCEVKHAFVVLTAATANQTVIAAVTGKKIVVLEGTIVNTSTTTTALTFKNGATNMRGYVIPANNIGADPNVPIYTSEYGCMRTSSGTALLADTAAGTSLWVSLSYIEVTP